MSKIDLNEKILLGDYVVTEKHNLRGRVYGISLLYNETGEPDSWFRYQVQFGNAVEEDLSKPWISILIHDSGAVSVPIRRVKLIEKFDFKNDYAHRYFRDN